MKKEIINLALKYSNEDNGLEFLKIFFKVQSDDLFGIFNLQTQTESGVNISLIVSQTNWKEDFKKYVENYNMDDEILKFYQNASHDKFTLVRSLKDFEDYYLWLTDIVKLIDEIDITPIVEEKCDGCAIIVLTFDKGHYRKVDLDGQTDVEKYNIANADKRYCNVYTSNEYTDMLNCFQPMEKYVWTYIIQIPNEELVNTDTATSAVCTQLSTNV